MSEPTLSQELQQARKGTRVRRRGLSQQERAERAKKATKAQSLAMAVLKARHVDEYDELYERAKKEVGLE